MKILALTVLLCFARLTVPAQETEFFIATQSGSPFSSTSSGSDQLFWNYSFGVEEYMADKITVALSYRKMFDLAGSIDNQSSTNYNYNIGYNYTYTQNISSFAIDFESKYFFDAPDDGWYISSGLSYQHIITDINVTDIGNNGTSYPATSPVNVGLYPGDGISIFPLSIKIGHRNSSDTFVFDYFFGLSYNMGTGNVVHKYDMYFDYDPLKRVTYIFGIKVGVKI